MVRAGKMDTQRYVAALHTQALWALARNRAYLQSEETPFNAPHTQAALGVRLGGAIPERRPSAAGAPSPRAVRPARPPEAVRPSETGSPTWRYLTRCDFLADNTGMFFTPQQLKSFVAPVAGVVREALDDGLALLPKMLGLARIQPDPWYDAHVVRRIARDRIEEAAALAEGWSIDTSVANSGIHLAVPAGSIRVAHGDVARVPGPGHSDTRRQFYSQGSFDLFAGSESTSSLTQPVNMLLLWIPSDEGVALTVAVPSGVWSFGGTARLCAVATLDDEISGEFDAGDDAGLDLVARVHSEAAQELS